MASRGLCLALLGSAWLCYRKLQVASDPAWLCLALLASAWPCLALLGFGRGDRWSENIPTNMNVGRKKNRPTCPCSSTPITLSTCDHKKPVRFLKVADKFFECPYDLAFVLARNLILFECMSDLSFFFMSVGRKNIRPTYAGQGIEGCEEMVLKFYMHTSARI